MMKIGFIPWLDPKTQNLDSKQFSKKEDYSVNYIINSFMRFLAIPDNNEPVSL